MLFPNCPRVLYSTPVHGIDLRCLLWASERMFERYPFWSSLLALICLAMFVGIWVASKYGESETA